ncbi:PilN domain-containing protein [Roseomonas populi]|uniref:PilN domain-containing protein n=1 Tax=Roseomonas populi TaxID=3121582 RepID=A0ABT1X8D5_9PROT|nr:PilN domain-containing protein [Roseomonas pecuniae]MCR0983643.1 PilN domain-containing protein [Roseomonas pecuniae]
MTALTSLSSARAHGSEFLKWWRSELSDMVPARIKGHGPSLLLDLREGQPFLARATRQGWRRIADFPPQEGSAGRSRGLRALASEDSLVVAVPSSWMLRRTLLLPAMAESRLNAVLDFEIEQHVPFAASEVVWAARILRRLPEAQRIEVEVAVLPRSLIASVAADVRGVAGSAALVARVDPAAEWPAISLDRLAPPKLRWRRPAEACLMGVILLLGLQFAQAGLRQQESAVAAIEARAASARKVAEQVLALDSDTAALRARLAAASQLRGERPASVAVVEELAQLLPDDVWLSELRLTGDQLIVSGFAARSDTLLELLDTSSIFKEVRFAAPVTRAQREVADRFQIGLRVVPAPVPQRLAGREPSG